MQIKDVKERTANVFNKSYYYQFLYQIDFYNAILGDNILFNNIIELFFELLQFSQLYQGEID